VCRSRETVRDFTSRASTKGINPLTRSVNGHGKLMEELIGCGGLMSGVFVGLVFCFPFVLFLCAC